MADSVVDGPGPKHDGTHCDTARCSLHRITHPVQGQNWAHTGDGAARPQDDGIGIVKSLKGGL